ncbi:MAG: hypothetical protein DWG76_02890 [Chloroflexi bacterium]|nr:hypothetical protein [Chloroflexota bacterium]MQC26380.1 hypothetical protein [Chloroflexota bacterium]
MKANKKFFALAIFGLAIAVVACGGATEATPTPTETTEATPTPTETPVPELAGASSLDLDDPAAFQSIPGDYTLTLDFEFTGTEADGSDASGRMIMDGANQADPFAFSMDVTVSGVADLGGVDHIQYVEIEDRLYFFTEINGCVNLPSTSEEDSLFNNIVDTGGFLTGIAERVQPNEVINGVPAFHYAIGPENLDNSDPDSMEVSELSSGAIYIAQDGGYVLRLTLEGVGVSSLLSGKEGLEGNIAYQLDFTPAPDGVSISAPESCDQADEPESDFPVLSDATNAASFGTFYSYQTRFDFDTIVDFYKTELAASGWTLSEEVSAAGTAAMLFEMGSRNLSIVVAPVPNVDGAFSVVVAEQ